MYDTRAGKKRKGASQATEMLAASWGVPSLNQRGRDNQLLVTQFQMFVSAVSSLRN